MKKQNKEQIAMVMQLFGITEAEAARVVDLATAAAEAAPVEAETAKTETAKGKSKSEAAKGYRFAIAKNAWYTFNYRGVLHFGKAYKETNKPHTFKVDGKHVQASDCEVIAKHANQGKALKAYNDAIKAAEAAAKRTSKRAAEVAEAEAAAAEAEANGDDARAAYIDKRNAAILQTIPKDRRDGVAAMIKRAHKAGYRYARLQKNKRHQLDGVHLYPGEQGHGRDAAFVAMESKRAKVYRAKVEAAKAAGKSRDEYPPRPVGLFVWSPVGGGNYYARGVFGPIAD